MKTAKARQEGEQTTPIWRVAAVINFPRQLEAKVSPYPGQTIRAISRIPQGPPLNLEGIFVSIQPWPKFKLPAHPCGPSGIEDEPAALVFFVAGEYLDAVGKTGSLVEPLLDSLSFQLQTVIHAYELQVLDMTPPVSVGMERDFFVSKYSSGKFIPSFPPTNVKTSFYPQLDLSLETASAKTRAALRWYIKGLAATYEVDKFVFFWTALEILRSQTGVSVSSPYRARCGHEIPNCPTCGGTTSVERLGESMKKFLLDRANTGEETAKRLWRFRQIIHGAKDLTYEDMRELPMMANSLRRALLVVFKSALGWPSNQPPLMLPAASGIITGYAANNIKWTLDTHDIELAIRGSDFFRE